ncbi:uncharacterized protein LOC113057344 isoform X2 [Carassius auratus]|uniref:Uncharacterized protein LOC113057344 isoform X2 n=1 Tax=Carassius auratus TaxID=7957 RepID=A0A6P6L7J9_CARAU|nr:uncharacterized protein LOC113057344 isoform X2 [Carassius auratus]
METLIKNYKTKSINMKKEKRETKREKEKEVLALFKKEGEDMLKSIKQARKVLKEAKKDNMRKEKIYADPPPYLPLGKEFPLLKGTMEVTGELELEGQLETEDREEPAVKTQKQTRQENAEGLQLDCYRQARTALEKMKACQEDKTWFEEGLERKRRKDRDIVAQAQALEEEMEEKIRESGKKIREVNKLERGKSKLFYGSEDENQAEELFENGKGEQGRDKGTLRPLAAQLPILIKGEQGQYVPWASQDLEGLVTRLPDIHEGAGKFIKVFEEETMGKLLAVGDVKALLAKILGGTKMDEILLTTTLNRAVNSHNMDGIVFDAFRPAVWQALRAEYPIRLNPKSLKGEGIGDLENKEK